MKYHSIWKKPNWQIRFRDLPTIPSHKQWREGEGMTLEQIISYKLLTKQQVTEEEKEIFRNLSTFYQELDAKLLTLDYTTFTEKDFQNFENYISYAFNYIVLISNKLTVIKAFRLVINEDVLGKNERITSIGYIKYPPLEVVKKSNKYNRSNTPNFNIFYCAQTIDAALREIKPPENKLVTVGVWKQISNIKLVSYPISHSESAYPVNESVNKATEAVEELSKYNSSLFIDYLRYYFKLLGREYSKKVVSHYEYYVSAIFSKKIFDTYDKSQPDFIYDCIRYPSVGNDYFTDNLAILPSVIDNQFRLEKVIEFEIEKSFYESTYQPLNPEAITLAKVKNIATTNKINEEGQIVW